MTTSRTNIVTPAARRPAATAASILLLCSPTSIGGCQSQGGVSATEPIGAPSLVSIDDEPSMPARDADVGIVSHAAGYVVELWLDCIPPPTNEPVSLFARARPAHDVALRPSDELTFDAEMQHHRHGLIQRPVVTPLGDGRYHISNVLLHMPGRWELYFDITRNGVTERAQWTVTLE